MASSYYQGVEFKACSQCKRFRPDYMQAVMGQTPAGDDVLGCGHVKPQGRSSFSRLEERQRITIAPPPESPAN